jgi:hypothetical protein
LVFLNKSRAQAIAGIAAYTLAVAGHEHSTLYSFQMTSPHDVGKTQHANRERRHINNDSHA